MRWRLAHLGTSALRGGILLLYGALSAHALAAGRATYGGQLQVAVLGPQADEGAHAPSTLVEATRALALGATACTALEDGTLVPRVSTSWSRPTPQTVRLTFPQVLSSDGSAKLAERLRWLAAAPTPYRALVRPVDLGGLSHSPHALEATLTEPWPDWESSLCHPATAWNSARTRPFQPGADDRSVWQANLSFALGRPYADTLRWSQVPFRGLADARARADVLLGAGPGPNSSPPARQATYLVFDPAVVGSDFATRFAAQVDRDDLARVFVRQPAAGLRTLLPPAFGAGPVPARGSARPPAPPRGGPRRVRLSFDRSVPDHRAVAERLQVKLHDAGLQVTLVALSRGELWRQWDARTYELMLASVVLPAAAAPALRVVAELGHAEAPTRALWPPVGMLASASQRAQRSRELGEVLSPQLPVLPLYAQGLAVETTRRVHGLRRDGHGALLLDEVSLEFAP